MSALWACAVCGVNRTENNAAMVAMTIFLSLLPLAFIGGLIAYLLRQAKKNALEQAATPDKMSNE